MAASCHRGRGAPGLPMERLNRSVALPQIPCGRGQALAERRSVPTFRTRDSFFGLVDTRFSGFAVGPYNLTYPTMERQRNFYRFGAIFPVDPQGHGTRRPGRVIHPQRRGASAAMADAAALTDFCRDPAGLARISHGCCERTAALRPPTRRPFSGTGRGMFAHPSVARWTHARPARKPGRPARPG